MPFPVQEIVNYFSNINRATFFSQSGSKGWRPCAIEDPLYVQIKYYDKFLQQKLAVNMLHQVIDRVPVLAGTGTWEDMSCIRVGMPDTCNK